MVEGIGELGCDSFCPLIDIRGSVRRDRGEAPHRWLQSPLWRAGLGAERFRLTVHLLFGRPNWVSTEQAHAIVSSERAARATSPVLNWTGAHVVRG